MPSSHIRTVISGNRSSSDTDTQSSALDVTESVVRRQPLPSSHKRSRPDPEGDVDGVSNGSPSPPQRDQHAQVRKDPITGDCTFFAAQRAHRPNQFETVTPRSKSPHLCAFCHGHENETPAPVWVGKLDPDDRLDSESDWDVRVVPNLYPAVSTGDGENTCDPILKGSSRKRSAGYGDDSHLFKCEPSLGGHEVVIESPQHAQSFAELNVAQIALVFQAYVARLNYWSAVPGIRYISIFKNVGPNAGASVQHSHSQLIASTRLPTRVEMITRRLQAHHARSGSCLQCDLIRGEVERGDRIVYQSDSLVAYCPYASQQAFQLRIVPRGHQPHFGESDGAMIDNVSQLVFRAVRWLEAIRPETAYNMLLHTCPAHFDGDTSSQHWAIDLFPRMTRIAGFELSSGSNINPIFPEHAASAYRHMARQSDPRFVLV
ncbi:MAG: galactose-1-phosphate uridylyltransferase [Planctomycetota bacterium]